MGRRKGQSKGHKFLLRDCVASNTLCSVGDLFLDHLPAKYVRRENSRAKLSDSPED